MYSQMYMNYLSQQEGGLNMVVKIPRPWFISSNTVITVIREGVYLLTNRNTYNTVMVHADHIQRIITEDDVITIELSFGVELDYLYTMSKPESRRSPANALTG